MRLDGSHPAPHRVSRMTLRPEYSLGHSAYNDFLFGTLGQDAAGTEITVLSALSRLGLDPWQDSARLAALPRDEAASALAATIARLPDGTWQSAPDAMPNERARPLALKRQLEGVAKLARGEAHHLATLQEALDVQEIVESILAR